ncbi:unnamed protein product [Rhizoctonia solani]|uniref:MYND-type domain-containing protein n=1 Tax=Rhizoctonia solani TaxID=456999 RepID=A0A8H3C6H9_9AGAM|nr:unnamed protein product [Rhizoctonia solani]
MDSAVDQRWGRPLEEYTASYGLAAAGQCADVSRQTEEAARLVKQAMSGRTPNAHGLVPRVGILLGANDITLPMLEAVLKLAHSPQHLEFFADQVFISGCIRFLAQIRLEGRPSPFSHEVGYLCFRIILIGIGVSILKMTENFNITVDTMKANRKIKPLLVVSRYVSRAILEAMDKVEETGSERVRTPGQINMEPFLLPTDLRNLLSMLWEDKKLYLHALLTTYLPGVSGVVFVLWQYLEIDPESELAAPSDLMVVPFCEILWRSTLAATEDEFTLLKRISGIVRRDKKVDFWEKRPRDIDLDDSRTLLCALNARMAPTDLQVFKPLTLADISVLLAFVTRSAQQGSEDLFPELFGGTLKCIWRAVETSSMRPSLIVDMTGCAFANLGEALTLLDRLSHSNDGAAKDLVAELEANDFIELLARLVLLLEPNGFPPAFDRSVPRNTMFFNYTSFLVATLAKVAPSIFLSLQFKDDWSKMEYNLSMSEFLKPSHSSNAHNLKVLHKQSTDLWYNISQFLALSLRTTTLPNLCSYPRCPYGIAVIPVEFMCTQCRELRYCSAQCQTRHWTLDHGEGSHKQFCNPSLLPLVSSIGAAD